MTPTAAIPVTPLPASQPETRALSRFEAAFSKAKATAGDGLILFRMGGYYAAYEEDAEIVASVLGIQIQTPSLKIVTRRAAEGGACRKSVLLTENHLQRNLRLLRAHGHDDIWIANQNAEPTDAGLPDMEFSDYEAARILARN